MLYLVALRVLTHRKGLQQESFECAMVIQDLDEGAYGFRI